MVLSQGHFDGHCFSGHWALVRARGAGNGYWNGHGHVRRCGHVGWGTGSGCGQGVCEKCNPGIYSVCCHPTESEMVDM